MFVTEYGDGAWRNPRIVEYAPFTLDPSSSVFHYGQAIFEGLKAYKNSRGEVRIFRPDQNFERLNSSADRLCIPPVDEAFALDALKELVRLDSDWIPTAPGTSLYIRPCIIAVESALGVHAASRYIFFIILSPVGAYYPKGLAPVSLYVEETYVRSAKGGTGHQKFSGNYAASLKASEEAAKKGFEQVRWLDSKNRKFVEEVGSMNIFFVLGDRVVTPALSGSILPGITRKSVIELLKARGKSVEEREISIDEITDAANSGALKEIFGTGTAAVISPVGHFSYKDKLYEVGGGKMGAVSKSLYDELTGIQTGVLEDKFGWVVKL
jgi:branched-chain amino acid aminotransferase